MLNVDAIENLRKDATIGQKVVLFQSTSSTNDIAWEYANNPDNHGLCVLAEAQTAGRGRRGRTWYSEPGQSILCSILLTKTNIEAELLTLVAAVATAEAMNRYCQLPARIKWPNDILIREQKVAGILVEKRIKNNTPCFVIGIGINGHQSRETFEQYELNTPATSLDIETGRPVDRTGLVCELLWQLEHWLDKAGVGTPFRSSSCAGQAAGPTNDPIIDRWMQLSDMLGRHITLESDGNQYSGFCRGIDPIQGLILQLDNSLVQMFSAAHTSIIPQ